MNAMRKDHTVAAFTAAAVLALAVGAAAFERKNSAFDRKNDFGGRETTGLSSGNIDHRPVRLREEGWPGADKRSRGQIGWCATSRLPAQLLFQTEPCTVPN